MRRLFGNFDNGDILGYSVTHFCGQDERNIAWEKRTKLLFSDDISLDKWRIIRGIDHWLNANMLKNGNFELIYAFFGNLQIICYHDEKRRRKMKKRSIEK